MPLIAAVTPHQAEGRWARRREGVPSQAGSAGTGTYIVFSRPAGVPGQSRQAGAFQGGGWGGVASWATCPPLLLQELSCCWGPSTPAGLVLGQVGR